MGGTDGSTSKVEVVAKKEVADDPQKTEEPPLGAEGGGELPLLAEGFRSISLSSAAGFRYFLEREFTEGATRSLLGGKGGDASEVEVV